MSTPRDTQAGKPQDSALSPTLYSIYIRVCIYKWYAPNTWCLSRSLSWRHMYIYDRPQRELCFQEAAARSQCYWNVVWVLEQKLVKIRPRPSNFLIDLGPLEAYLTLNGRNILFVNYVKCLGVIFNKRITRRLYIEMTEAKALRTLITIYSLF
jgi:hypothetical protein